MRDGMPTRKVGGRSPESAFAGIDVACAAGKRLPVDVSVRRAGRLVPLPLRTVDLPVPRGAGNAAALDRAWCASFADATAEYLRAVEARCAVRIVRVGIDAPSAPRRAGTARRASEAELARRGISCFATPSAAECARFTAAARTHLACGGALARLPHANRIFMLAGFALFARLRHDYECLEVYPQGAVAVLGCGALHKSRAEGLAAQRRTMARVTGWRGLMDDAALRATAFGARHDLIDAFLAAWVASLDELDREPLGGEPDDTIWLPRARLVHGRRRATRATEVA
jgi:hypothetical protein